MSRERFLIQEALIISLVRRCSWADTPHEKVRSGRGACHKEHGERHNESSQPRLHFGALLDVRLVANGPVRDDSRVHVALKERKRGVLVDDGNQCHEPAARLENGHRNDKLCDSILKAT